MKKTINTSIVKEFYKNSLKSLHQYDYFHLITRLWLITNDAWAKKELDALAQSFKKNNEFSELSNLLQNYSQPKPDRQQILMRYPIIRAFARDAFATLFAKKIWNLNLKDGLISSWDKEKLSSTKNSLLESIDDIHSLATYAVNYLTLYNYFYENKTFEESTRILYRVFNEKEQKNFSSFNIYVYFLTHIIINDSLFYTREIPQEKKAIHRSYLSKIEEIQKTQGIDRLSVDCNCELQVCMNLTDFYSDLQSKRKSYVEQFISINGNFITEPTEMKTATLSSAEHTNVMYIAAFSQAETI